MKREMTREQLLVRIGETIQELLDAGSDSDSDRHLLTLSKAVGFLLVATH